MERQEVFEKVAEMIGGILDIPTERIKEESRFKEDLSAISLDLSELSMMVEDEFGDFKDIDDIENRIVTVGDVVTLIMNMPQEE